MKVVSTRTGQYNQVLRGIDDANQECMEVFELLKNPDGTDPPMMVWVDKKDDKGNIIPDEGDYVVVKGKDGKPVHADFAEDKGNVLIRRGPLRGETHHLGWMLRVPESVACGFYPLGTDFWTTGVSLPPVTPRAPFGSHHPKRIVAPIRATAGPQPT